jgi:hypothetical protein
MEKPSEMGQIGAQRSIQLRLAVQEMRMECFALDLSEDYRTINAD